MEHQPLVMEKPAKRRRHSNAVSAQGEEGQNEASDPKPPPNSSPTLSLVLSQVQIADLHWDKIKRKNLDLDYTVLLTKAAASSLLQTLEEQVDYFTGDLARVRVFGKWHNLPRKQVRHAVHHQCLHQCMIRF